MTELASADEAFRNVVEEAERHLADAERAMAAVQRLKAERAGGIDALRTAQEAGSQLLNLSQRIGDMGPLLCDATMEIAECGLELAARFAEVPAALLLTDVALSCTFEASRVKHATAQLLEVRTDTTTTLQTLQTNLDMAKIIGSVDAETFKLSLGLVDKASRRIVAALRQVASSITDARKRVQQCGAHANAVVAFAARRNASATVDEQNVELPRPALPAPENWDPSEQPQTEARTSGASDAKEEASSSPEKGRQQEAAKNAGVPMNQLESRLQNDRLLRQLNGEILVLQRRAREHVASVHSIASARLREVPQEAKKCAFDLVAEVISGAADLAVSELKNNDLTVDGFDALLTRHFSFVEACSCGLAMPADLRTQLVRFAALLDAQALLTALVKQVKPRLAACCESSSVSAPLLDTLDRYFDRMADALVAARMA